MIKIKRIFFLLLGSMSFIYYLVCMAFAGFKLSFVWIWPLLSFFCFVRYKMLTLKQEGKIMWEPPKWLVYIYRGCIIAGLTAFVLVESQVVMAMNAKPQEDLDYIIVLGAGMKGTTPTRPLQFRIQTAYDYMMDNPDTILIASGGQGLDEEISEAECIRNTLVEMGLEESRIWMEDKSRDTMENIRNSYELLPDNDSEVGIVTNSFHIWRSVSIAKSEGYENVSGVPAKTLMPVGIHYVVREFFGFLKWKIL